MQRFKKSVTVKYFPQLALKNHYYLNKSALNWQQVNSLGRQRHIFPPVFLLENGILELEDTKQRHTASGRRDGEAI